MNPSKVSRVRGEVLFTCSPSRATHPPHTTASYSYTADREDSSSEVIWANAGSHYEWAYQWPYRIGIGSSLAAHFTFSHSGAPIKPARALGEFLIAWPS
jgi:hypothetical protein